MGKSFATAPSWLVREVLDELSDVERSYGRSVSFCLFRPCNRGGRGRLIVRAYYRDVGPNTCFYGAPGAVIELPSRQFIDIGGVLTAAARECRDATPIHATDWGRFTELVPGWLDQAKLHE